MVPNAGKKWIWVVVGMLLLASLACGGGGGVSGDTGVDEPVVEEDTPEPTDVPTAEPTADSGGLGSGGTASLDINNNAGFDLCYLYVAPSDQGDLGDNQLDEGSPIASGTTFTLDDIPFGTYTVQVNDCDGSMINALYGVNFDQDLYWDINEATLIIVNSSSFNICELYISPNSAPESEWGSNQIEGDPLNTGEQVTFTLAEGSWDARAVPCDSSVEGVTQLGLEVSGEFTWTLSDQ